MCDICDALPYGACDSCAKAQKETPKLFTEVFGEELLVIDVLRYSADDYYEGRSILVMVVLPTGGNVNVWAPFNSVYLR